MHALVPILIAANNKHEQNLPTITKTTTTDESGIMSETKAEDTERMSALEAKAVAEATATADRAFTPSPSLLNSASPTALLKQVDGPSLANYKDTESVYVGRSIPVSAGSSLSVPIQVNTPGSIVEYAAENKSHDIGFGITAEREEGITIVQEMSRCDASELPMLGKFLVGTVPCLLQFKFDNEYSYFREKNISYKITITPPSKETLMAGRRRRAQACINAVEDDLKTANSRLDNAQQQRSALEKEIEGLKKQMELKQKSLAVANTEEKWLVDRVNLRKEQQKLLAERLEVGWEDEEEPEDDQAK